MATKTLKKPATKADWKGVLIRLPPGSQNLLKGVAGLKGTTVEEMVNSWIVAEARAMGIRMKPEKSSL